MADRCSIDKVGAGQQRESKHAVWVVPVRDHLRIAARIVDAAWPTLVVCAMDSSPVDVAHQLGQLQVPAAAVSRGQGRGRRERALGDFSTGRARALVASEGCVSRDGVRGVRSIVHLGPPPGGPSTYSALGRATEQDRAVPPVFVTLVDSGQTSEMLKLMAELSLNAAFGAPAPDDL